MNTVRRPVNITQGRDKELSMFICSYLLFDNINSTIQVVFGISGTILTNIRLTVQIILIVFLVRAINHMKISKFGVFVYAEFAVLLCYLYSRLVGNNSLRLNDWIITMATVCIPMFVSAFLIQDKNVLYGMLRKFSWPMLVVCTINFFMSTTFYDMHFSYAILPIIFIQLTDWFENKKLYNLLLAIAEMLMMIIHGSRGAILCAAVFFIIKVVFLDLKTTRKITLIGAIIIVLIAIYKFYTVYIGTMDSLLRRFGISGRSINLILSGQFFSYDSERRAIWNEAILLIKQHLFTGWGIGGAASSLSFVAKKGVVYPHQLFLDLILTFGIVIGIILSIVVVYFSIKMLFSKNNDRNLNHIYFSIAFVSLMFSGTLFTNTSFYIMMGLGMSSVLLPYKKPYIRAEE